MFPNGWKMKIQLFQYNLIVVFIKMDSILRKLNVLKMKIESLQCNLIILHKKRFLYQENENYTFPKGGKMKI